MFCGRPRCRVKKPARAVGSPCPRPLPKRSWDKGPARQRAEVKKHRGTVAAGRQALSLCVYLSCADQTGMSTTSSSRWSLFQWSLPSFMKKVPVSLFLSSDLVKVVSLV